MSDVAVLGAGWSGLAAARALDRAGIPFDGFDRAPSPGGLWREGQTYASLRLNTSRDLTSFSDLDFPPGCPDYPGRADVARYLETYADRFDLRRRFRFGVDVREIRHDGQSWRVDGQAYKTVLVGSGHHALPRWPEFPGSFDGLRLHASEYREPSVFEGRRVLVVGLGNSAVDIAVEAASRAAAVMISTRRGAHVLPKRLLGRPTDVWGRRLRWLPMSLQSKLVGAILRLRRGRLSDYGLPEPAHRLHQAHPTLSDDLLPLLRQGRVRAKPDVAELRGRRVRFSDGGEEDVDVLLCATGYRAPLPFLKDVDPDALALYLMIVPLDLPPGLFFIGRVQPQQGPISRTSEAQAAWVVDVLRGAVKLPSREAMREDVERREAWRATLVASPRHGLEVEYYGYLRELRRASSKTL